MLDLRCGLGRSYRSALFPDKGQVVVLCKYLLNNIIEEKKGKNKKSKNETGNCKRFRVRDKK